MHVQRLVDAVDAESWQEIADLLDDDFYAYLLTDRAGLLDVFVSLPEQWFDAHPRYRVTKEVASATGPMQLVNDRVQRDYIAWVEEQESPAIRDQLAVHSLQLSTGLATGNYRRAASKADDVNQVIEAATDTGGFADFLPVVLLRAGQARLHIGDLSSASDFFTRAHRLRRSRRPHLHRRAGMARRLQRHDRQLLHPVHDDGELRLGEQLRAPAPARPGARPARRIRRSERERRRGRVHRERPGGGAVGVRDRGPDRPRHGLRPVPDLQRRRRGEELRYDRTPVPVLVPVGGGRGDARRRDRRRVRHRNGVLTNAVVPGNGGTCLLECSTTDELQAYTVEKTSSAGGTAHVGDVVTYTVTVTNTGAVDYTEQEPASFADDLSAVLDDASYNDDATAGAIVADGTLTWAGALETGASIDITYSVTVLPTGSGDGVLTNVVVTTGPGGDCADQGSCTTTDELQAFTVEKAASATMVNLGDTLTYTIVVTNTGAADFTEDDPAIVTDDLSEVLDDATYNGDATNGAVYTAPELSWALAIPAGQSVTLTYSVDVNDPATGDLELVNAVTPGPGGECADGGCSTETPVASYTVTKSVDAATTAQGEKVTYTVTVTNTGAVAYTEQDPATFTDDLSEVLDDATYNDDATNGAVYDEPVLSWAGALEVGESVTVTYSVTVNEPASGDRQLVNTVVPGDGGSCGDACSTTTDVEVPGVPGLPATGLEPWAVGIGFGGALAAILGGLVLIAIRRPHTPVDAE